VGRTIACQRNAGAGRAARERSVARAVIKVSRSAVRDEGGQQLLTIPRGQLLTSFEPARIETSQFLGMSSRSGRVAGGTPFDQARPVIADRGTRPSCAGCGECGEYLPQSTRSASCGIVQ
jgi:hypothetical protein